MNSHMLILDGKDVIIRTRCGIMDKPQGLWDLSPADEVLSCVPMNLAVDGTFNTNTMYI